MHRQPRAPRQLPPPANLEGSCSWKFVHRRPGCGALRSPILKLEYAFDVVSRALLVHNSRANPPLPATLPGPPSSPPWPLLAACWLRALRGPTLQHYRHDQARQRACGAQGGRRGVIFDGAHEGPATLSTGQFRGYPQRRPQSADDTADCGYRVFSIHVHVL